MHAEDPSFLGTLTHPLFGDPDCILNDMGCISALIPVRRWVGGDWWSKGETGALVTQERPWELKAQCSKHCCVNSMHGAEGECPPLSRPPPLLREAF